MENAAATMIQKKWLQEPRLFRKTAKFHDLTHLCDPIVKRSMNKLYKEEFNNNELPNLNTWKNIEDEIYTDAMHELVRNDKRFKVGDVVLLRNHYRAPYGLSLVGYNFNKKQKELLTDGEGFGINDIKNKKLKFIVKQIDYKNANLKVKKTFGL